MAYEGNFVEKCLISILWEPVGQKQMNWKPKENIPTSSNEGILRTLNQLIIHSFSLESPSPDWEHSVLCMNLLDDLGKDSSQETNTPGGVTGFLQDILDESNSAPHRCAC